MEKHKAITLKYRVSLPNIKGFFRVYSLRPETTLFAFEKAMESDMDFPQDQVTLYKAFDSEGNVAARYSTVDLGYGAVDQITFGTLHKEGIDSFVYFYDTRNKRSVLLNFVEEMPSAGTVLPQLLDSLGPNPLDFENGYVALEDLSDEKKKKIKEDPDDLDDEDYDDSDDDSEDEDIADEAEEEDEN